MAYPYSFIKLTFGGDLQDTDEVWSCGFHIGRESANTTQSDLENIGSVQLDAIRDSIASFVGKNAARIPSKYRLQWIKLAAIGTNGKYLGAPVEIYLTIPQAGTSTAGFVPQNSTVVTLVADKFKDPGKYNRFYIPAATPNTAGSYRLTQTQAEGLATAANIIIEDINLVLSAEFSGLRVRVVSQKAGIYRAVTKLRVGDLLDTQRRRRNALREEYVEENILTG